MMHTQNITEDGLLLAGRSDQTRFLTTPPDFYGSRNRFIRRGLAEGSRNRFIPLREAAIVCFCWL